MSGISISNYSLSTDKCYFCGRGQKFFDDLKEQLISCDSKNTEVAEKIKMLEEKKIDPSIIDLYSPAFTSFNNRNPGALIKILNRMDLKEIEDNIREYSQELPELLEIISFYHKYYFRYANKDYRENTVLSDLVSFFINKEYDKHINNMIKEIKVKNSPDYGELIISTVSVPLGKRKSDGYCNSCEAAVLTEISICPICKALMMDAHSIE